MTKHVFELHKGRKLVSVNDISFWTINLKPINQGTQEIELGYNNIETFSIVTTGNQSKFLRWSLSDIRSFRPPYSFNGYGEKEIVDFSNRNEVKAEVVLDADCEYQLSLSYNDKKIIVPRSSLAFSKNLNLKNYYDKEIELSLGTPIYPNTQNQNIYSVPKVMYGNKEICKLNCGFVTSSRDGKPIYTLVNDKGSDHVVLGEKYVTIDEKDNEFLVYLSNYHGEPVDMYRNRMDISNIYSNNINAFLRSALLKSPNVKDVLPELEPEIDNNLGFDTRQLECWIKKRSTIQEIASELVADRDNILKDTLIRDTRFRTSVSDLLKSDVRFQPSVIGPQGPKGEKGDPGPQGPRGPTGVSPSANDVATLLLTDRNNKNTLVNGVANNQDLQNAVAGNQNLRVAVKNILKSDTGFQSSVKGPQGPKGEKGDPGPQGPQGPAGRDGESPALNLVAAQLINDDNNRNTLVTEVANNQSLQNAVAGNQNLRVAVKNILKSDTGFQSSVKGPQGPKGEKGDPGPQGPRGPAGVSPSPNDVATLLLTDRNNKNTLVNGVANNQDLQNAVAGNQVLKAAVTNTLKRDTDFQSSVKGPQGPKGEKGDPGPQGPRGLTGVSPSANDVATQLLADRNNKNTLVNEVASNQGLQNAVAGNQVLKAAVTHILKNDRDFQHYTRGPQGPAGRDGISPSANDVATQLLADRNNKNTLVNEVASNQGLQNAVAGNQVLKAAVTHILKNDRDFLHYTRGKPGPKGEKGDPGNIGPQGPAGRDGESPALNLVAAQLLNDDNNRNTLVTEVANNEGLQSAVAGNQDLRAAVTNNLKSDTSFQSSVRGPQGKKGDTGPQGPQGEKGKDANPVEVAQELANDSSKRYKISNEIAKDSKFQNAVKYLLNIDGGFKSDVENILKSDEDFKNSIKGEKGDPGQDANPVEVAQDLANDSSKRYNISNEIAKDSKFQNAVKYLLNIDGGFKSGVGNILKSDEDFKNSVKGEKGDPGNIGPQGPAGRDGESPALNLVAAQLLNNDNNRNILVTEVANNEGLQSAVAGNQDLRASVTNTLKSDETFQATVKGEPGPQGPKGEKGDHGENGISPSANDVATQLLIDSNEKNELVTRVASNQDLQNAVAGNQDLRAAVTNTLKSDETFQASVKGEPGPQGPKGEKGDPGDSDVSTIVDSLKQKFTLQKGERLSENIYEAKIVLNDKTIATLPKIGYYMLNEQLVIRNHVTQEKVTIPEDFHYLKVVRLGSGFGSDDYKLTFCNTLGNEFFEYKKYDPEYSNVSDEYRFISLNYAKKEYNLNLSELLNHRPLFFITKGPTEPGSDKYAAAVFELTRNGTGKKMATLIDEFGYFDQSGMFIHCNYHEERKCRSYTSDDIDDEIDKEYQVTDADSEFYLAGHDTTALHTIPEL